jgi:hypothetical protein
MARQRHWLKPVLSQSDSSDFVANSRRIHSAGLNAAFSDQYWA